jgi:hypothetical protein
VTRSPIRPAGPLRGRDLSARATAAAEGSSNDIKSRAAGSR